MVKQAACNVNKLQRMLPGIFYTTLRSVFLLSWISGMYRRTHVNEELLNLQHIFDKTTSNKYTVWVQNFWDLIEGKCLILYSYTHFSVACKLPNPWEYQSSQCWHEPACQQSLPPPKPHLPLFMHMVLVSDIKNIISIL
jgi:hypothetical protein